MTIAAKHFDPVVGIDIHIVQPPGTVPPVPIPHPFVGVVLDPFDYLPIFGATVLVNGLPRGQAGSAVVPLVPHVPIGGVFVKPPGNEGELLMGSSTVVAEGEPFSYLGLPALSCSDIGVPPPPRVPDPGEGGADTGKAGKRNPPKDPGGPPSAMLPTSVVLSIPMGRPVVLGGIPTISIGAIAFRGGLTAFQGLRKLRKHSNAAKRVSARMHARAERLMDAWGISDNARHKVHTAICTVTGHPVDVATGKVFTEAIDLDIPGPLPLVLERKWLSTSGYRGPLGHGWHHNHDLWLRVHPPRKLIALRLADGRARAFPLLEVGERWFDRKEKIELARDEGGYVLRERSGLSYRFSGEAEDQLWPATSVEDRSGNRIELVRDPQGRLVEIHDSGGRRFPISCDEQGRIVEIRGPHPTNAGEMVHVRYVYDRAGDLVEVYDALGRVRRYEYRSHLLIRETDRAGLSFYFEYDHLPDKAAIQARCIRTWGDGGIFDHKLEYAEDHTIVADSLGHRDTYFFNDRGLVERAVDALGHIASARFDQWDNIVEETDELGRIKCYSYDLRGTLTEQIWPDGSTARFAYDEHDQLVRAIDQNGGWWRWARDERGRLIERLGPDGSRTRLIWRGSRVESIVDGRGGVIGLDYDAVGNLVKARMPDGGVYSWAHDRLGRRTASQSPTGAIQRLGRDLHGGIIEVHEPDGLHRWLTLDGEGRPVQIREPHRVTELGWVGMGRLVYQRIAGIETRFIYDTEQRLIGLINAHGGRYRFERDARGDVIAETGWAGDRRELERDAAGQIVRMRKPSGAVTTYAWNRVGKLERVVYDDGSFEHFGYRADGLLTHARNDTCTIKLERDAIGRVIREWQDEHWISSTYDREGARTSIRSSFGAHVDLTLDAMGRWSGIDLGDAGEIRWRASTQRDVAGSELDRQLPGGARDRWRRDPLGRPLQQQVWDGRAVVRDRRYTWNVDARIDRLLDALTGTPTEYGHDALGRLTWAPNRRQRRAADPRRAGQHLPIGRARRSAIRPGRAAAAGRGERGSGSVRVRRRWATRRADRER